MLKTVRNSSGNLFSGVWFNLRGRWQFQRGQRCAIYTRAYETFHNLLDVRPHSFTAHFFLGQIARERGLAQLAFDHYLAAYRCSVIRFNRSSLPDDLKNHIALRHSLSRSPKVAIHELEGASRAVISDETAHQTDPLLESEENFLDPDDLPEEIWASDFRNPEEAQRFQNRPPITEEEVETVDLDQLIKQLQAGG